MALIDCPECKGKVSTEAMTCPHCGYPMSSDASPKAKTKNNLWKCIQVGATVASFAMMAFGIDSEALEVVLDTINSDDVA
jgi:transcription elongation factor Elf1